jgi:hypothetical protein
LKEKYFLYEYEKEKNNKDFNDCIFLHFNYFIIFGIKSVNINSGVGGDTIFFPTFSNSTVIKKMIIL